MKGAKMKSINIPFTLFIFFILCCFMACQKKDTNEHPLLASFDFEDSKTQGWQPSIPENWEATDLDGSKVYALTAPGERREIAAPTSWSVLSDYDVTSFAFSGRLKCAAEADNPHRDICVFFHYQDPTHFYYVHFSASSDERHNIIGLVNAADRVKINLEPAGSSVFRLTDKEWHTFKVTYDAASGDIQAFLDDMETPIVTAQGSVLGHGFVGIGSYDDTGYFDDLNLRGIFHNK
jgi:hypothetical protein